VQIWFQIENGPQKGREYVVDVLLTKEGLFHGKTVLARAGISSVDEIGEGTLIGCKARAVITTQSGTHQRLEILEVYSALGAMSAAA
jgi:hypothetical protein